MNNQASDTSGQQDASKRRPVIRAALGIVFGAIVGLIVGAAVGSAAMGLIFGAGLGLMLGSASDWRRKNQSNGS
jgi:F0F1-type ATP synthase assembly protein I